MKVAYLLTEFPSASETFAAREIDALIAAGWEVTVLTAGGGAGGTTAPCGPPCIRRPQRLSRKALTGMAYLCFRYPLSLPKFVALLISVFAECPREAATLLGNIHAVGHFARCLDSMSIRHVHAYFLNWPACIGMATALLTGRTLSLAGHARDIFVERGAIRAKVGAALFVTLCTQEGLKWIEQFLTPEYRARLTVNRHGVAVPAATSRPKSRGRFGSKREDEFQLLAVGRLVPKKGFEHAIRAARILMDRGLACRLTIVGSGPSRLALARTVEDLRMGEAVRFEGWVCNDHTLDMMLQAHVLVVPSVIDDEGDRDGIPNAIIEAFALGTPVVASSLPAICEAVRDGVTGILAKPADPGSLADAVWRIADSPELAEFLSANGRLLAESDYDPVTNVGRIAALLKTACESPCSE